MDQVSRSRFGIACAAGLMLSACLIPVDDLPCSMDEDCPARRPACDQRRGFCTDANTPDLQPAAPDAGIAAWDEFVWGGAGWQ
jgi:hypothetical protein